MSVSKIQIAPWFYQKLNLGKTTYVNEQQAIDALTEALNRHGIKFSIVDNVNRKGFLNEFGGELAAVVPV